MVRPTKTPIERTRMVLGLIRAAHCELSAGREELTVVEDDVLELLARAEVLMEGMEQIHG